MTAARKDIAEASAAARARAKWNGLPPDWIVVLAEECDLTSQRRVAARLQIDAGIVNRLISNSYGASVAKFEQIVRGVLMAKEVDCPVLGAIASDRCIREQGLKKTYANPLRPRIYDACRSGCKNSRLGVGK